jgi:cytochrome c553
MKIRSLAMLAAAAAAGPAFAYPGGTPSFQTDVAPYCAGCHSSRDVEMLAGAPDYAQKQLAERKHISLILSGQEGYASLSEEDRRTLAEQIRALDAASTVVLAAPTRVNTGQAFEVRVEVTGGAGPAVGVALVDRAHRWFARPAASAGWQMVAPPRVTGPDGEPQDEWLAKRPAELSRNLSFVNVTGIESDSAAGRFAKASVIFTLRAPLQPGSYPLVAAYLYGTEKSTVLGYTTNAVGWKEVRGGTGGGSGRILFSPTAAIEVVPAALPGAAPAPGAPAAPPSAQPVTTP